MTQKIKKKNSDKNKYRQGCGENWISHTLLIEMWNATTNLENSSAISYKTKCSKHLIHQMHFWVFFPDKWRLMYICKPVFECS